MQIPSLRSLPQHEKPTKCQPEVLELTARHQSDVPHSPIIHVCLGRLFLSLCADGFSLAAVVKEVLVSYLGWQHREEFLTLITFVLYLFLEHLLSFLTFFFFPLHVFQPVSWRSDPVRSDVNRRFLFFSLKSDQLWVHLCRRWCAVSSVNGMFSRILLSLWLQNWKKRLVERVWFVHSCWMYGRGLKANAIS